MRWRGMYTNRLINAKRGGSIPSIAPKQNYINSNKRRGMIHLSQYTSIRFKGIVKEKYASMLAEKYEQWHTWLELFEEYPTFNFLKEYGSLSKADFVPNGVLMGEPSHWTTKGVSVSSNLPTDGFYNNFDEKTRLWSFQCSINDPSDTVDKFFDIILPELLEESLHIERYLESTTDDSLMYELRCNKIVLIG